MENRRKTAVVLFNLGGPDRLDAVRPFLFNLFSDPAIINMPNPFRWLLAQFISRRREPIAKGIYTELGGGSPILGETKAQARALTDVLNASNKADCNYRVFVCMRYWHPMSIEVAAEVQYWKPDRVVLLPLYPHFSTATTASSIHDWNKRANQIGIEAETTTVCCYATNEGYVTAQAKKIRKVLSKVEGSRIVLFSAHGLPKKIVDAGDPYQFQIEQTAEAVAKAVGLDPNSWMVCYQSRVGRLEWIGPSLDEALEIVSKTNRAAVIVPISFVSEHSETLVELDIEYKKLAEKNGCSFYKRVPALGIEENFIKGLTELVLQKETRGNFVSSVMCPSKYKKCPCQSL